MRSSTQAIALGGLAYLFGRTLAVPLDPTNDQKSLGFNPDTYLYFTGDVIPQEGPGPAPDVTVPGWKPPPDDPPGKKTKRGEGDQCKEGDQCSDSDHTSDAGSEESGPDLPPLVWLDRSREVASLPPFMTAEYDVRRRLREAAQGWIASMTYPYQGDTFAYLRHFNTDGTWQYMLQLSWLNPQHYSFPHLVTPARPLDVMVRRNADDVESHETLRDWLTRRIDPGSINGYAGSVMLANERIIFGYRIWHARDLSAAREARRAAQTQREQRGQGTPPHPAPGGASNPNPAPPPKTPFGSPIINRPEAFIPPNLGRGEDTGVARVERAAPLPQHLLPSLNPPPVAPWVTMGFTLLFMLYQTIL